MNNGLKKGIITVFSANLINVIFSLATNMLLPHLLSIESYAGIKTYQLYAGYIGLMHLGFIDGMYLFMGGKKMDMLDVVNVSKEISTLRISQMIITCLVILSAAIINNKILIFAALSILPVNMAMYYRYLYQSTGEYKLYGRVINSLTILTCFINLFLLFIIRTDNLYYYIIGYVLLNYLIDIGIEFYMSHKKNINIRMFCFSLSLFKKNIIAGYSLTLGNIAFSFLVCMGQWFVSFFLTTNDFAQYSFAVTLVNFINIAITPISITLYNYFCNNRNSNDIINIRKLIVIFASLIIVIAFCCKFLVDFIITKYVGSISIMFLLVVSQLLCIINTCIYVNLYKAEKKQSMYMKRLIMTLIITLVINVIITYINKSIYAYAIGTLIFSIIWLLFSCLDFEKYKLSKQEIIYMLIILPAFLILGNSVPSYWGAIIYLSLIFAISNLLYKDQFNIAKKTIKSKYKKLW